MLTVLLTVPAFAITEAEVEAQVNATSREAVTGNVLIWFLCAVAFLKVSQKVDSFMATLSSIFTDHTPQSLDRKLTALCEPNISLPNNN